MSQSHSTTTVNGVTFLVTTGKKTVALFPRIPREQYNYIVDSAQPRGIAKIRGLLKAQDSARVQAFRDELIAMQREQHRISTFERVRFAAQKGANALYRKALRTLIAVSGDELKSRNIAVTQEDLFGALPSVTPETVPTTSEGAESAEEIEADGVTAFAEQFNAMAVTG